MARHEMEARGVTVTKTVTPLFAKDDVWAVARAIERDWARLDEGGYNAYLWCGHCDEKVPHDEGETKREMQSFPHKSDCVVLKARDLLTGAPACFRSGS